MDAEQIRETLAISKGKPFKVVVAGGKTYDIPHPDYLHIHPSQQYLLIFTSDRGWRYDIVDLNHVCSIEDLGFLDTAQSQV